MVTKLNSRPTRVHIAETQVTQRPDDLGGSPCRVPQS